MPHRILIASTSLPPVAGGAEQAAWEVAKRLANDLEVHVLTCARHVNSGERLSVHRVPRVALKTLFYSTLGAPKIYRLLKMTRPEVVHSHMVLPWGYVLRNSESKKVITCHGSDVFPKKPYPMKYFVMSALQKSDAISAPSKWLSTYVEEKYGLPCRFIPNGVDTERFRPIEGLNKRSNVVLFVGRFIRRKGVMELVRAAKELPQYEFWLVGNPGAKGAVELPSLPNIKEIGFVDVNRLVSYYNEATICAFPSHWENAPVVGLEAMACGRPLVATRLGFSEFVENGREGILVPPRDAKELVDAIRYLMENEDVRRRFEQNARKRAMQYDWGVIAQEYRALYKHLLGGSP